MHFIKRTFREAVHFVVRGRIADVGFWITVAFCGWDWFRDRPMGDDLTRLMIWLVLTKLNRLEQSGKRKRYIAPKIRRLEWADLTAKQQAWIKDQQARHV